MSWGEWKKINEDLIALIRAYDAEKISAGGGAWIGPMISRRCTSSRSRPNASAIPCIPMRTRESQPWEPKWE